MDILDHKNPDDCDFTLANNIIVKATPGSGNQSIAARTIFETTRADYDRVIVVWSGINRIDFPIGKSLHKLQTKNSYGEHAYAFFTDLGEIVYYHSGGWGASGFNQPCPRFFIDFFKQQYLSATPRYLTDLTLLSIIQTQSYLEMNKIWYDMKFIYNINADWSNSNLESVLGSIDKTSPLMSKVNWNKFQTKNNLTLYEFARDTNRLFDILHPKFECIKDYFRLEFDINLTS